MGRKQQEKGDSRRKKERQVEVSPMIQMPFYLFLAEDLVAKSGCSAVRKLIFKGSPPAAETKLELLKQQVALVLI